MKHKKYIKENISVVRDGFSKYLGVSTETPVIIIDRNQPKSVLISYPDFIQKWGINTYKQNTKPMKKKYTNFKDFIGIANPAKKKINIKKEISDAWSSF